MRNLDEALRWCRPRFSMYDLERSLRSPDLAPTSDRFGAEQALEVVQDVIERRRTLLLTDDMKPDVERREAIELHEFGDHSLAQRLKSI